jgi:hypothetical protein
MPKGKKKRGRKKGSKNEEQQALAPNSGAPRHVVYGANQSGRMNQIQFERAADLKRTHDMKLLSEAAKYLTPDEESQMKDYEKYKNQLFEKAKEENHAMAIGEHAKWQSEFNATNKELDDRLSKLGKHAQLAVMKQTNDDMQRMTDDLEADSAFRKEMGNNYSKGI